MRAFLVLIYVLILNVMCIPAAADVPHPPLKAYGELAKVRGMTLSPDGNTIAFITRDDGVDLVTVYDMVAGDLAHRVRLDNIATRQISFADNTHLIIQASDTAETYWGNHKFEFSASASLDLQTNELTWLLYQARDLSAYQTGLGRVIGRDDRKGAVFMPAFMGKPGDDPSRDVLRVDLKTGRGKVHQRGTPLTTDWVIDRDGTVMAREDYSNATNTYTVYSFASGKKQKVFEAKGAIPPYSVIGMKEDRSALILIPSNVEDGQYENMIEVDFEGHVSDASFPGSGSQIEAIYQDMNQGISGVRFAGALPSYSFYDPGVDQAVAEIVGQFPASAVFLQSNSDDWSKLLYLVYDGQTTGRYILQDRTKGTLTIISTTRPEIPDAAVGEIAVVKYPARDGLSIPAILTWPAGSTPETRKKLPLVVMPHGGPASYDSVSFDWMAQYFANRGYLVLQPNFRGSAGYGKEFMQAGYGEWGGKMQDDVTDGVLTLVQGGIADPARICIVGASYGGYAALAGGAFTPDLYKCVVSIGGISDVPELIREDTEYLQQNHWVYTYLKMTIGDLAHDRGDLKAISPVNAVDRFTAPVLLIHGADDTVVPFEQSKIMATALEKSGKSYSLVELEDEDHWLSEGDTRIAALEKMAVFVDRYIGTP